MKSENNFKTIVKMYESRNILENQESHKHLWYFVKFSFKNYIKTFFREKDLKF